MALSPNDPGTISFQWQIIPSGITVNGERLITRVTYNLTATGEGGATGDLGSPGIAYLPQPIPADEATGPTLAEVLAQHLGPANIAVYKRIAVNNLASFKGEAVQVQA